MIQLDIDTNLIPETSKEKGYIHWKDIIYDPEAPNEVNEGITKLLEEGWKLGKPASMNIKQNNGVGLYKPINP